MAAPGISSIPPVPQTVKDPALRVYLQALQTTVAFLSGQKNTTDTLTLISGLRSELNELKDITVANNIDASTIVAIQQELEVLNGLIETRMTAHEAEYHAYRYRTMTAHLAGDSRLHNFTGTQHEIGGTVYDLYPAIYIPNKTVGAGITTIGSSATYELPTNASTLTNTKQFFLFSVERPIQVSRVYSQAGAARTIVDVAPNYYQYEYGIYTAAVIPAYMEYNTSFYPGMGTTVGVTGATHDNDYRLIRTRWPGRKLWGSPSIDSTIALAAWPNVLMNAEGSANAPNVYTWSANFVLQPGVYFFARHIHRHGTGGTDVGMASNSTISSFNADGHQGLSLLSTHLNSVGGGEDERGTYIHPSLNVGQNLAAGALTGFTLRSPAGGAYTALGDEYAGRMVEAGVLPKILSNPAQLAAGGGPAGASSNFVDTTGMYTDAGATITMAFRGGSLGGVAFAGPFIGTPGDLW